jgi:hypothetical protein
MLTLVYKRTHEGDPDPLAGVFGVHDCMHQVRDWPCGAIIGIGGVGPEPQRCGIARRLTWIGIGPRKDYHGQPPRQPLVRFDHFLYLGQAGPPLPDVAPGLAAFMYDTNRRVATTRCMTAALRAEVANLLDLARRAPASGEAPRTEPPALRC